MYELKDHPHLVYKKYTAPLPRARASYDALVEISRAVSTTLTTVHITALWPQEICGTGSVVEGYTMRRIPDRFHVTITGGGHGSTTRQAELQYALSPTRGIVFRRRTVTIVERLQILLRIGQFLEVLHSHDLIYGDISWRNMLFALDPTEVAILDMDGVHRISAEVLAGKDGVHTPDWEDPKSPDGAALGFDQDRYRYGLLAYRMLVSDAYGTHLPEGDHLPSLDHWGLASRAEQQTIEWLLKRSCGPLGSRPPISEWVEALRFAEHL